MPKEIEVDTIYLKCNVCTYTCELQISGVKGKRGPVDQVICPLGIPDVKWEEIGE